MLIFSSFFSPSFSSFPLQFSFDLDLTKKQCFFFFLLMTKKTCTNSWQPKCEPRSKLYLYFRVSKQNQTKNAANMNNKKKIVNFLKVIFGICVFLLQIFIFFFYILVRFREGRMHLILIISPRFDSIIIIKMQI